MLNADLGVGCNSTSSECQGSKDCPGVPDLCIKRRDNRPSLKISMTDCDGVVDLSDENLVLEASMWFDAKLKSQMDESGTEFSFADNVGFDQIIEGDIVITGRARDPEKMLVTSINESARSVSVQRAHLGTNAQVWPKGTTLRVFRFIDQPGQIESVFDDVTQADGNTTNELTDTFLVFNWTENHTSMPGCYWLEFKLIMISPSTGQVEWTKRIPLSADGFVINIIDSPTAAT